MPRRVLVVDDLTEMHVLIRRALGAHGYEVQGATTLAEALRMNPAGYDAVLVDARLGGESGADLIEMLRLQDPAGARRCVIMTGGPTGLLPAGVTLLAKPFQISELLDAVVKAQRPPGAAAPRPTAPRARVQQLLRLVRLLRVQERCALADYLHDGPIQDLTAASLELQLMRRSAPPGCAPALEAVQAQVDGASAALRWLVDGPWPLESADAPAADVIRRRATWLLGTPPEVAVDLLDTGPVPADPDLIADVVELTLLAIRPSAPGARAGIAVSGEGLAPQILLTLTPGRSDGELVGWLPAQLALAGVTSALGASLSADFCAQRWLVRLSIPQG
jgi:ActR/RegA family two-component response regulator